MTTDGAPGRPLTPTGPRSGTDGWSVRTSPTSWRARAARRWWLPGVVSGAVTAVVSGLLAAAWLVYEAGGCGGGAASFACLGATLMGIATAAVVGPPALWLLYRLVGVRHPVLAVPVAAGVALCLLAVPELLHQVGLGLGVQGPGPLAVPVATGLDLGVAAAAGGLALQGPRRARRGAVAGAALVALVVVVLALQPATDREETRLELGTATVPLLLPDGWGAFAAYVGPEGDLTYTAVPPGHEGYGFDGVRVEVTGDVSRYADTCGYRACTDDGDVRTEVGRTDDGYGSQAWRVVDGALVTVTTGAYDAPADLVGLLRAMEPVDVATFLDRRYTEPLEL